MLSINFRTGTLFFVFFYGDYKSRLSLKEYTITIIIIHRSGATTSCKYDETLTRKNDLSCFKSLLVTGL